MNCVNKAILVGRLGTNPIQRYTKTGVPVVHFSLATSKKLRGEDGTEREETQWHQVVVWGKQAEACAEYFGKGDSVFLEGSFRSHEYQGKDGRSRTAFEVHAERVNFLTKARPKEVEGEALAASA